MRRLSGDSSIKIIGAGPAGITAAAEIAKAGKGVEVFEAGSRVGGLARTFPLWGRLVDLGPHRFFSNDRKVNQAWLEAVGSDYTMVDRLTRIHYGGKLFDYPLRPLDAFSKLGPFETARCLSSYALGKLSPPEQTDTFEDWVTTAFGRRLFEIFFKTYSEKLWGISCSDLDADFAQQRIKTFTLQEAVASAFMSKRRSNHQTLVDRFAYPLKGTGYAYEQMAERVHERGGSVRLNTPVQRVVVERNRVKGIELTDSTFVPSEQVISTMPLTMLVERLDGAPEAVLRAARSLRFRNTILVYLLLDADDIFPDNWVYVHSNDLRTGRITNYRNWSPGLYEGTSGTIISMEYWANDNEPLWSASDSELIEIGADEIGRTGMADGVPVLKGHVERIRRCYPVYRKGYRDSVQVIRDYLDGIQGLQVIGRYGSFKYNNQDHSILMGLLAAENLMQAARHDLWTVNTDYAVYQEKATITESGLEAAA